MAPDAFGFALRAPQVAAAIGRGLERAGIAPPELCPVAGGGRGTVEALLPVLGGETADGFALIEDGGTAIVEPGEAGQTGARITAAVDAGAAVLIVAAAGLPDSGDSGARIAAAVEREGGLRGARLVVLCEARDVTIAGADSALAQTLARELGAKLVPGAGFVLDALGFDARMRAARAVIVGDGRLDARALRGRVAGEIATRARQAGVPCHAITACNELNRFDARILDLQAIIQAGTTDEIEAAGASLAAYL
ncbi:MAG: glycerate 2-kinase [Solirubrobacteraceae bacterium]|nr:glycerate 2-kinase [Solirubrobacteraceae bacterium]